MTVTLELLGKQMETLISEVRGLRESVDGMRTELDGQFGLITAKHAGNEALERLVAALARRVTVLERAK
jgi:hypothetical protein